MEYLQKIYKKMTEISIQSHFKGFGGPFSRSLEIIASGPPLSKMSGSAHDSLEFF